MVINNEEKRNNTPIFAIKTCKTLQLTLLVHNQNKLFEKKKKTYKNIIMHWIERRMLGPCSNGNDHK